MSNWNWDAQFADEVDPDYLYVNAKIRNFLKKGSYAKFIIVASKGMGKTLLLRHKRKELETGKSGILLVPRNEMADYVNLPASLKKDFLASMEDQVFWEDVWKLSVSISILLHFPHDLTESEIASICASLESLELPEELETSLVNSFSGKFTSELKPSSVLDVLIQSGKSALENTRSLALHKIHDLYTKYVTSGCFVFIDSFDQALTHNFSGNLKTWCAAQTGLMKAAWELSRHNRHVKVYVSIRQEAFSSFKDSERLNVSGSAIILEYSRKDLEGIFLKALKQYEDCDSVAQFLGLEKVYNGYLRTHEESFEYLYRHTIGVPRWLMRLGEEISSLRAERGIISENRQRKSHEKAIADVVNRISGEELALEHITSEMRMFFGDETPEAFLDNLLDQINSSVLSLSNLQRISEKFQSRSITGMEHPFCLLFNLGFIGYVAKSATGTSREQVFKKPYQFDWNHENILPSDPQSYYLLHPSIHHLVQRKNYRFNFNKVRIGDGISWTAKQDTKIHKETLRVFISYTHSDWDRVCIIANVLETYFNERAILFDIWLDRWKMKSGKWVQDQMLAGLVSSDYLVFAVSKESLQSNAVEVEWKTKFADKLNAGDDTVFPIVVDNTPFSELPLYLRQIFSYRFEGGDETIIKLAEDILFWKQEA